MIKRLFFAIAVLMLAVAMPVSCTKDDSGEKTETGSDSDGTEQGDGDESEEADNGDDDSPGTGNDDNADIVDDNSDDDTFAADDFTKKVTVTWSADGATVSPTNIIDASIDGGHVVLGTASTAVKKLDIVLTGSSSDGSLKIYNGNKQKITLDGVSLQSKRGAALNNQCGKRTFVYMSEGKTNSLVDAAEYTDVPDGEDCKGCFFSEAQLIFSGTGSLKVTSNAKHGIATDDYLRVFEGAVYILQSAKDGIHANDYIRIDGGEINVVSSSDGIECEKGYINIVGGDITVKSVDDGVVASYEGDKADIVPYINIAGGKLNITTTGEKGMAIKAVNDVLVSGGYVKASVSGIASKCIKSGNNVDISGGELDLTTTGSAKYYAEDADTSSAACIKSDNNVTVANASLTCRSSGSGGKGINCYGFTVNDGAVIDVKTSGSLYRYNSRYTSSPKGIRSSGNMTFNGGTVNVAATGTNDGAEAIESKSSITINGGDIYATAYDDGINVATKITFNGGRTYAYSTHGDGVDSNGTITINGGVVVSSGTTQPEEGFDCDQNTFTITGGVAIGFGGTTSTPTSSVCTQRVVVLSSLSASSGQCFDVRDKSGNSVLMFKSPRSYNSMTLLMTTPAFANGSYSLYAGGTISGGDEFGGYYTGATYSGGSQKSSFTISSMVTGGGGSGGNGGGHGGR